MGDYMPKCATCGHFESCIIQKHLTEMALILWNINRTTEQSSIVGDWKWESEDVCDNCGYKIPHLERVVGETVLMDSKDWKYCPNCGEKIHLE